MGCLATAGWGPLCVCVRERGRGSNLSAGNNVVQSSWGQARRLSRERTALLHCNLQKLLHYTCTGPLCLPVPQSYSGFYTRAPQKLRIVKSRHFCGPTGSPGLSLPQPHLCYWLWAVTHCLTHVSTRAGVEAGSLDMGLSLSRV